MADGCAGGDTVARGGSAGTGRWGVQVGFFGASGWMGIAE